MIKPEVEERSYRTEAEILSELTDLLFKDGGDEMVDVFVELTNRPYTEFPTEVCRKYFDMLDRYTKFMAYCHGLGDTEVREAIYAYFEKKGLPNL